jgi:hypothetical protein
MQERHRALRAQLESLDPAVTGELPPRDRDRARGLLAEGADGDQADRPAAASRHRDDGDVERAPRRRVVAHERDDELVDDVPSADREESLRGSVRVLRRRADRGDDIERAPRRRVVAHEREDELDDEVLAEEREESRHGDVGARRRRKPEQEDFDEDGELEEARVFRRARVVKPADVRALRRRSREEAALWPRTTAAWHARMAGQAISRCIGSEVGAGIPQCIRRHWDSAQGARIQTPGLADVGQLAGAGRVPLAENVCQCNVRDPSGIPRGVGRDARDAVDRGMERWRLASLAVSQSQHGNHDDGCGCDEADSARRHRGCVADSSFRCTAHGQESG